jgi:spermidine/putrescine transport system permease protein
MAMSYVSRSVFSILPLYTVAIYLFLYLPIMVLILFSFNASGSSYQWAGFTMHWYYELLSSHELWHVLKNTLIVATVSASLSVIMSVLFVYYGNMIGLIRFMPLFLGVVALPDIIIAVSLLTLFMAWYVNLGFITLIIGHTLLGLGFAVPLIATRFQVLDNYLLEAAMDLGATPMQALYLVIIPLLFPSLVTAFLLVFMVSLDDFLISFFCSSSSTQTLSLYVFSLIRSGSSPLINALSTLILAISSLFVLLYLLFQHKGKT